MADDRRRDAPESAESRENGNGNGIGHGNGYAQDPQDGRMSTPQTPRLYRLNSNTSSVSIFEDVEMAHDEVSLRSRGGRTRRAPLALTETLLACT